MNKDYIELLPSTLDSYRVNWVYCVKFTNRAMASFSNKLELLSKLSKVGVEARDYFYPADHQIFYQDYCKVNQYRCAPTCQSLNFYENSIYLPTYLDLDKTDVAEIIKRLEDILHD